MACSRDEALTYYRDRLDSTAQTLSRLNARYRVWMNVWFVQVFLLALTFYLLYAHGVIGHSGGAVAACFTVEFLLGSVIPAFLLRIAWKTQELRRLKAYYEGRMSRLEGDWSGRGDAGDEFFTPDHPYSADLDVFGEGSLFEYLCSAQTGAARECLAGWLLSPSSAEEILERQQAIEELRDRNDLREYFATAKRNGIIGLQAATLREWLSEDGRSFPAAVRLIGGMLCVLNLAVITLAIMGIMPPDSPLATLGAVGVFTAFLHRRMARIITAAGAPRFELELLAHYASRLRQEKFCSPLLMRFQHSFCDPSPKELRALIRRMKWMSWHEESAFTILSYLVPWGIQFAMAVENRRLYVRYRLLRMAADVGQLEALCSLSAFAFEHSDYSFPEFVLNGTGEDSPVFEAKALGHPLIADEARVANPVAINRNIRFVLVSGSNMSGKSTYLRAIGLNYVLARAGAPVCAERLRLSMFGLATSMRVEDSLRDSTSRFWAEVTRVKEVIALAETGPTLFLLDELLSGTNSADRRAGVTGVIGRLLEHGASGLLTTHDLALAKIVDAHSDRARNAHFVDCFTAGEMTFDYRIREGVVPRSNGLAILTSLGIVETAPDG